MTESRHRWRFSIGATIRSATSFWKVRVSLTRPYFHALVRSDMASSQSMMSAVDTLNGRLPMMCMLGEWSSQSRVASAGNRFSMLNRRMSPLKIRILSFDASFNSCKITDQHLFDQSQTGYKCHCLSSTLENAFYSSQ